MNSSETVIAHLNKEGKHFEIVVYPNPAYEFKNGTKKDLGGVLVTEEIFKDAKKGERQTENNLKEIFGTTDAREIAKRILKEGEIQFTTEHRRKLLEEKRKRLINTIASNCIDPRTKAPHPPQRIERAMDELKIRVDLYKPLEEQVKEAIEKLREVLPISVEKIKIAVRIPATYAAKAYGVLKEYGLEKEEWEKDGSLVAVCSMIGGMQSEFYDKINKITHGEVQTKLL